MVSKNNHEPYCFIMHYDDINSICTLQSSVTEDKQTVHAEIS